MALNGEELPSSYLKAILTCLNLREFYGSEQATEIGKAADEYQKENNPGKPHITMGAVIYWMAPLKFNCRRTQPQVQSCSACSPGSFGKRIKIIQKWLNQKNI